MMFGRNLLKILVLSVASCALFAVLVYLFFPVDRINGLITRSLEAEQLSLSPAARKSLLPGLIWKNALISSPQGPLAAFDRLTARPLLTPLLMGRVTVGASALIAGGHVDVTYGLTGGEALSLDSDGVSLAGIPFFKTVLGARVAGNLWARGATLRGPKGLNGEYRFEIKGLEYSGAKVGGFSLPDASNLRCQGMVRITGGRVRLESVTLQGEGLYMRLSGEIPLGNNAVNAPLDVILEIMPKPDFMERQKLVFLLLARFMVSPGNFRIPVHGTLLKPVIM